VPDWERERLPLLYAGDTLIAVPGIAVCEGFLAQAGQAGFMLGWSRLGMLLHKQRIGCVPHDKGGQPAPISDGANYDSTTS